MKEVNIRFGLKSKRKTQKIPTIVKSPALLSRFKTSFSVIPIFLSHLYSNEQSVPKLIYIHAHTPILSPTKRNGNEIMHTENIYNSLC